MTLTSAITANYTSKPLTSENAQTRHILAGVPWSIWCVVVLSIAWALVGPVFERGTVMQRVGVGLLGLAFTLVFEPLPDKALASGVVAAGPCVRDPACLRRGSDSNAMEWRDVDEVRYISRLPRAPVHTVGAHLLLHREEQRDGVDGRAWPGVSGL